MGIFLYLSSTLLKETAPAYKKNTIKKKSSQFVVVNPTRGNIYDPSGLEITSTHFMYKMIYRKIHGRRFFNLQIPKLIKQYSEVEDILYDRDNCLQSQNGRTVVCTVSVDYIYDNLELLRLFEANVYPIFKRTRNFTDYDFDFVGTTGFAEGRKKNVIIRKILMKLQGKISNKKHLNRIIKTLKLMDILSGNFGVELYYDSLMRGRIGVVQKKGNEIIMIQNTKSGDNIYLTIDIQLNRAVKEALKQFCKKLKTNCAAVGMNAENGDILFLSEIKKENLDKPLKQFYFSNIYQGLYPPGSILKPFVSLELLEKGIISGDTKSYCGGRVKLYNRVFNCWASNGHGNIDITSAIEHSCNVFFYNNIQKLNAQDLRDFISRFKLNKKVHIDLPNESLPKVNAPVNPLNKTLFAIGQIDIYVSLLKLVQLYSLFYNKRFMPVPHIAKAQSSNFKVHRYGTNNKSRNKDKIYVRVRPKNIQIVKQGLYNVVHSKTGTAHNLGLEKYKIYGKTGTVQVGSSSKPHSLFCGLWEGRIPVSLCVIVENSGSGRDFAAKFTYNLIEILEKFFK